MFSIKISLILTALLLLTAFNSTPLNSAAIADENTKIGSKSFIVATDFDDNSDNAYVPQDSFIIPVHRFLFSLSFSSHELIHYFKYSYAIRAPPSIAFS